MATTEKLTTRQATEEVLTGRRKPMTRGSRSRSRALVTVLGDADANLDASQVQALEKHVQKRVAKGH